MILQQQIPRVGIKRLPPGECRAAQVGEDGAIQPSMEYMRSPSSLLIEMTVMPFFLRRVPDRNPRTECGSQPVAFISSFAVTPPGRLSNSSIVAVLLLSRDPLGLASREAFFAPVGVLGLFFARLAFFSALPLPSATGARRGARAALLLGFGGVLAGVSAQAAVSSVIIGFILVSLARRFRDDT